MTDRTSAELDAWLAEVEKRCKAATPGPWKGWVGRRIADVRDSVGNAIIHWAGFDSSTVRTWRERGANARFIAHARTDVPELLRLVRELQAENVRLKDNQDACLMGSRCPMPKGYHDVEEFYRD